jgi:hypothetical protein
VGGGGRKSQVPSREEHTLDDREADRICGPVDRIDGHDLWAWGRLAALLRGHIVAIEAPAGYSLLPLFRRLVSSGISSRLAAVVCLMALDTYRHSPALTFLSLAIGFITFVVSMLILDRRNLIEDRHALRCLAKASAVPAE